MLLLIEVCNYLKDDCLSLLSSLRRRFPGRIAVKYNVDYLEDDIEPRPDVFSVVWEMTNELLFESTNRVATVEEMESILKPIIEPPKDPTKSCKA
ncbi:hypothetical protein P9112_005450 [Eukaryota sp. TZLM1-RC]